MLSHPQLGIASESSYVLICRSVVNEAKVAGASCCCTKPEVRAEMEGSSQT